MTASYLERIYSTDTRTCTMQVVFADIVSYSKRPPYAQIKVIDAFMKCLDESIIETARHFVRRSGAREIDFTTDIVTLPSGDGAAVGFPVEGELDVHLRFAKALISSIHRNNEAEDCRIFTREGWCDCHSAFRIRIGVSEGKLILYRDINGDFNVAGNTINLAARVMDVADSNQVLFTQGARDSVVDFVPNMTEHFKRYDHVRIKHDLYIPVYQYVDDELDGLNSSASSRIHDEEVRQGKGDNRTGRADSPSGRTEATLGNGPAAATRPDVVTDDQHMRVIDESLEAAMHGLMVEIPAGRFRMGDSKARQADVVLKHPFLADKYPVTQALYRKVTDENPSHSVGDDLPVDSVSWLDAVDFCNKLSSLTGLEQAYDTQGKMVELKPNANGYRLPTEAEWEYACRANEARDGQVELTNSAWYARNSGQSKVVGQLPANAFGLHDMLGNVWEWCNDWYQKEYPKEPQEDPAGPDDGIERVIRGGSWIDSAESIRPAYRNRKVPTYHDKSIGFRLVRKKP